MKTKQNSLKKNSIYTFINNFMGLIMPIITFPYASRILLPEGLGKVNFSHSIVSYFAMIGGLGISSYAIREAAKIRDNKKEFSKFAKEIFIINMTATIVAYLLLTISLLFIPKLSNYITLIIICSVTIMLTTLGLPWIFSALEEFKFITIRTSIFQIISLVFLFTFVKTKDDIIPYTIFGIISSTGSNICNFFYASKFINWNQKTTLEIKKHLKPVFTLFAMTIAQSIYLILDSSILGFISGDKAVGFYHAATKINKMIITIISSLGTVLIPRLSYYLENDKEKYYTLLNKSFNMISMLSIPITAGFFLLSKPIMLLFCGENYIEAIEPMNIITPIIYIISISSFLCGQILLSHRKDLYSLISISCGALLNLILNLILIPYLSYNGAAIATVIAETIIMIIAFIFSSKLIPQIYKLFKFYYQYIIATLIMSIIVYILNKSFSISIINLFLQILIGMIIYYVILLIFRNPILIQYSKFYISKLFHKKGNKEE